MIFKTTYNILKKPWEDELSNRNWQDTNQIVLPPRSEWDYAREMNIDDVDIWEVLYESSGGIGVYASWQPYAEFYMITTGWKPLPNYYVTQWCEREYETHYGPGAQKRVIERMRQMNIPVFLQQNWVEEDDMWLYA